MTKTTKRFWTVSMMVVVAGALGACADQPTGPEEPYTVEMDEGSNSGGCIVIGGELICKD